MKRFLFCLLVLWICGCSKLEESPVPNWRVYINIDLRFQDRDLVGSLHHKSITSPRTANEYIGYSGVLVICGFDTTNGGTTYYAYDLCCPNELKRQDHKFLTMNRFNNHIFGQTQIAVTIVSFFSIARSSEW